ncbi:MAG: DUF1616 domain-containing protein [Chloroflexi bacterium]|nr:DUF1616 domain-containing protein [Chloroflexota bacterium]
MEARSLDLQLVTAFAVIAVITGLVPDLSPALRATFGASLVLVLPGYAIAEASMPEGSLGRMERLLLSVGLSLALVAMSGLLLNLTPWGLNPTSWILFLGTVTVVASVVAIARRRPYAPAVGRSATRTLPNASQTALLIFAGAILTGAIGVAFSGAAGRSPTTYSSLWILPGNEERTVTLGVSNREATREDYRVELSGETDLIEDWTIQLEPGASWTADASLPPADPEASPIVARLYRTDSPHTVLRQVILWRGSED